MNASDRKLCMFAGCVIIMFLTCSQASFSQNPKVVDSLENLLKTKTGKDRWDPLYELAFEYVENDFERAIEILNEAYSVSLLGGDSLKIVKSLRVKGYILGRLERSNEQLQCYSYSLPIAKRNEYNTEVYYILNSLGNIYLFTGEFDKALEHYLHALEIVREPPGDTANIAQTLNNLGLLFYKMNNYVKALEYYEESVRLSTLINLPKSQMAYKFLNMAICNCAMGRITEAEHSIKAAKKGCDTLALNKFQFSVAYTEGCIELAKGNYIDAKTAYLKSYLLSTKINNRRYQIDNLLRLAQIAEKQHDRKSRKQWLDSALSLIDNQKPLLRESLSLYNLFSEYYLDTRDYPNASHYQKLYIELNDKVTNLNFSTRMMEVESRYLNKQHQAELAAEKQISQLKEEVIRRQKFGNVLMGVILLMLVATLGSMISTIRSKRKINKYLEACVQRRTRELQEKTDHLLRLNLERNAKVTLLCSQLKQFLATVTGLSLLTDLDSNNGTSSLQHLAKIKQDISDMLADVYGTASIVKE
jgi:tetratricopeptide (TPR) repeat protein